MSGKAVLAELINFPASRFWPSYNGDTVGYFAKIEGTIRVWISVKMSVTLSPGFLRSASILISRCPSKWLIETSPLSMRYSATSLNETFDPSGVLIFKSSNCLIALLPAFSYRTQTLISSSPLWNLWRTAPWGYSSCGSASGDALRCHRSGVSAGSLLCWRGRQTWR